MFDKYVVEKILDRKKEKNWKGYKETTWEKRADLMKDIPEMIKEYEQSLK